MPTYWRSCTAKLPGGSRTIKALAEVYDSEGLPRTAENQRA